MAFDPTYDITDNIEWYLKIKEAQEGGTLVEGCVQMLNVQ